MRFHSHLPVRFGLISPKVLFHNLVNPKIFCFFDVFFYKNEFFSTKVKYSVTKNGAVLVSGHPDICNTLDHKTAEQKAKLEVLGFPTECPVPEGRKCMDGTKKVDISKYKNFLAMLAGKLTAHYEVTHDTVCFFICNYVGFRFFFKSR